MKSPAAKGLMHFFFASRATASVPGITDQKLRPSEVKCVGVVGGGLMVLFVGPLSFSGYGDLDPLINSGFKVLIAMILIFVWVFALLKIKNWIFRKIVKP